MTRQRVLNNKLLTVQGKRRLCCCDVWPVGDFDQDDRFNSAYSDCGCVGLNLDSDFTVTIDPIGITACSSFDCLHPENASQDCGALITVHGTTDGECSAVVYVGSPYMGYYASFSGSGSYSNIASLGNSPCHEGSDSDPLCPFDPAANHTNTRSCPGGWCRDGGGNWVQGWYWGHGGYALVAVY